MKAYNRGAMIAGTSAGAAVMSKEMITGNELVGDSAVSGSFKAIRYHMVELKEGLGLIRNAVIDQHFVARSRYNRLLSVLAEHPATPCIGIDEGTALIVQDARLTVTGIGQVIRLMLPAGNHNRANDSLVKLQNIRMDIFVAGDQFYLHQ
jgi:cyanophycinase